VEREHFDPLDIAEVGHELGDVMDAVEVIGEAGDQNIAQIDGPLELGEAAGKIQGGLEINAGKPAVGGGVPFLDVEEDQVDILKDGVVNAVAEVSIGIEGGVELKFFAASKDGGGEFGLDEGFSAADGDTAVALEEGGVAGDSVDNFSGGGGSAAMDFPGIGVVAIKAAEDAASQKDSVSDAGSVGHGSGDFGMDPSGDLAPLGRSHHYGGVRRRCVRSWRVGLKLRENGPRFSLGMESYVMSELGATGLAGLRIHRCRHGNLSSFRGRFD
jgi:hypothetical protein